MEKLGILLLAAVCLSACMPNYGKGQKAGYVVKVDRVGVLFTSYEAEIMLGGTNNGSGAVGTNVWAASTPESSIGRQLNEALESGNRCLIHYHQWAISPPWIDTDLQIDDVQCEGSK